MLSPGSCFRCNRALPPEFVGELCPVCASAGETSQSSPGTPHSAASVAAQATASFVPPKPQGQLTITDPFAAGAGLMRGRQTVSVPDNLPIGTDSEPPSECREELPPAPPGFDLLQRLGRGGMGDVFLAHEYVPERLVAIKFLRATGNPVAVERFLAEVRALARADHPHIVRFLAADFYRAQPFFTMEYASGGSLADRVSARGPLDPEGAARIVAAAARAVHAAHAVQVLHRDLKPSNILLAADGHPRVSDFGLAKLTDQDGSATGSGPLGTPGFMPPEQINPRRGVIGPASDVYGLGATLYYLLTGKPPFTGETPVEIVSRVERDPPVRPRSIRPEIPLPLEAVVLKCLEKEPGARYSSAEALAIDLENVLAGRCPQAPPLTRRRRTRQWLVRNRRGIVTAAVAVMLAGLLIAGGRQLRDNPPPPPSPQEQIRAEIAAGKRARLLDASGRPRYAAWPFGPEELGASPDDGGTCSYKAMEVQPLLLLDDPGVDSYLVRAEIAQLQKLGDAVPGNHPAASYVGLVLGYAGQDLPDGSCAHLMMALKFTEFDPTDGPTTVRAVELMDVCAKTAPGFALRFFQTEMEIPAALLTRVERAQRDDPVWRPLEVRVTPAGVWVPGPNGKPQLAAVGGIASRRRGVAERLARGLAGPFGPFPDWSPRLPLGIWVRGSWVAVRNVTVESTE